MMHADRDAVLSAGQLRVLVLNSRMDGGGIDSHTLSLCRALRLQDCVVSLAAPARARWIDAAQAMPGIQVLALDAGRVVWPLVLSRYIREQRIDVIHAHHGRDYWVAIAAWMLSGRTASVVVTRHLMTQLKERTRRYLAAFSNVIAVSDAVQESLRRVDPERALRLRRIYCGIDTERFRRIAMRGYRVREALGLPQDAWVYAMIGGAQRPDGKGQFYFVKAATQVLARHPQAHFLCVGEGDLIPQLRHQAQALGLARHIHFLPFEHDVASLLQAIDVLVHPAVGSEALGLGDTGGTELRQASHCHRAGRDTRDLSRWRPRRAGSAARRACPGAGHVPAGGGPRARGPHGAARARLGGGELLAGLARARNRAVVPGLRDGGAASGPGAHRAKRAGRFGADLKRCVSAPGWGQSSILVSMLTSLVS